MINEANAVLEHDEAADTIAANWRRVGIASYREFVIPNNKRADVLGCSRGREYYIAEVKHTLKASLIEEAMDKYAGWCNYLFYAVAGITEADLDRRLAVQGFPQPWHRVGIIGVYPGCMRILRPPSYRQIGRLDASLLAATIYGAAGR